MPHRNPFDVLDLPLDATTETIRSAWRRLARENHPDVTSGGEGVEQRATRRMAEINAAYLELKDPASRRRHREEAARAGRRPGERPAGGYDAGGPTPGGQNLGQDRPVAPSGGHRGRTVTARIDTSALFRPRNATLNPLTRSPLPGLAPMPRSAEEREAPRASTPSGPTHRRPGPSLEGELPSLGAAMATPIAFGKFAGLTLRDVADLEPTYVDWMVKTVNRDPDLLLAARVVLRHLERRGKIGRLPLDSELPGA